MVHIFLSFLFFNIILLILYSHYKKGEIYIKKSELIIYIVLFILFGTYGGGEGDYIHYKEHVENYSTLQDVYLYSGMEQQYVFLSYLVDGNYDIWRLVIFSIQFIGLGFFLYKAKLNTYPVLFSFVSFMLVCSVYGRSFWGAIYFFMGVYLLIEKKNPLYLIAIALCYVSHTSNLILIALLPLAFVKLKQWHIFAVILLFGLLVSVFKEQFTDILKVGGFDVEGAEYLNGKLNTYGNNDSRNYLGRSIGETVTRVLRYLLVFSVLLLAVNSLFKRNNSYSSISKSLRSIINISIGVVLLSFIVMASSVGGAPLFYRTLDMTLFPVTIILPCIRDIGLLKKKTFNLFLFFFVLYTEIGYIKDLYYAYANGIS